MKRLSDTTIFLLVITVPSTVIATTAIWYAVAHYSVQKPHHTSQQQVPTSHTYVYPSPNKHKAQLSSAIDIGSVNLEVIPKDSFFDDHNNPQSIGYTVRYTSEQRLQPITIAGNSLDVGCIAKDDHNFHDNPSIFSADTSLGNLTAAQAILRPYASVDASVTVPGDCQYIGTADGVYWWPVSARIGD